MTHSNDTRHNASILVLGANGKTGKRVASKLEKSGHHIRRGSRSASPAFDWQDESGWHAALTNIKAVYVSYFPDLAVPQAPSTIHNFCAAAKAAGVEHLVLLSGRGEPAAQQCEQIVQASGINWTVVRASWFNQNFSEGEFANMVAEGTIALPARQAREPFVDVEDIADVAVAALTGQCANKRVYEVTGPRLMSFAEVADELSHALDREIRFLPISDAVFAQEMRWQGAPADTIELLMFLFNEVLDGRNAHICNGVEQALGRPARDFREFAHEIAREIASHTHLSREEVKS